MNKSSNFYDFLMATEMLPLHIKFAFFVLKEFKEGEEIIFEYFLEKYKCSSDSKNILKSLRELDYGENFIIFPLYNRNNRVVFSVELCGKKYTLNTPEKIKNVKSLVGENNNKRYVREVFDFWKSIMGEERKSLTVGRKRVIEEALNKYSVDECKDAIIGCSKSLHHMGYDNFTGLETKKKYNDILNIFVFKRGSNFEKLIEKKDFPSIDEQRKKIKPKKNKIEKRNDSQESREYL